MRIRPLLFVAPVVLAGTLFLAEPGAVQAAGGVTETGTATYEVVPAQNLIQVTVEVSIRNDKPSQASGGGGGVSYSWNSTTIAIEQAASPVVATSNAGGVSQSTVGSDNRYRTVKLNFANVFYGQTRVVTAKYSIPGSPQAAGAFHASAGYASLCAAAGGRDSGLLKVIIPDGYDLRVDSGGQLTKTGDSGGKQVFSSGAQSNPKDFWTCVAARSQATLSHSSVNVGSQAFDLQGWPGDSTWTAMVGNNLSADVQRLEDLTGLTMPGGTIVIAEVGNGGLTDHGLGYDPVTKTVRIPQSADPAMVAHALSHIWFNPTLLKDTWLSEGLATFSEKASGEGNYAPCDIAPAYPGSGAPDLMTWHTLNLNSTIQNQNVYDWQYAASCAFFTSVAKAMGPDNFKNVLKAAAAGEMAYNAGVPGEKAGGAQLPLTSQQMLDLLDERGMIPAGVADLDQAQQLLGGEGVSDPATLAARFDSRTVYHAVAAKAGTWKLPPVVREPMSKWDFPSAQAEMAGTRTILDLRDLIEKQLPSFSLDGTDIQTRFESAATQADLDDLAALMRKVSDASAKFAQAAQSRNGVHDILQTIGLIGADLDTPLKQARADLQRIDPDAAGSKAESVTNRVNGSRTIGLLWVIAVGASVAFVLTLTTLLLVFVFLPIRRRKAAAAGAAGGGDAEPPA